MVVREESRVLLWSTNFDEELIVSRGIIADKDISGLVGIQKEDASE